MKTAVKLLLFTLLVTAFYTYVGQMVPQSEVHPPKSLEIRSDLTTEEMVEVGQGIFSGKGTCASCHTVGSDKPGRFPDLGRIGANAGGRKPGLSDLEYLAEAVYEPGAYIVEGFSPGMPAAGKSPIGLTDQEILTVLAYLQSLGGTPSVTMDTKLKYASSRAAAAASPAVAAASPAAVRGDEAAELPPARELLQRHNCLQCHSLEKAAVSVGPGFHGMGRRLSTAQIYEAILNPDAVTAKGYPKGVMTAALKGAGFYEKASAAEIGAMAEFLAARKEKPDAVAKAGKKAKGKGKTK